MPLLGAAAIGHGCLHLPGQQGEQLRAEQPASAWQEPLALYAIPHLRRAWHTGMPCPQDGLAATEGFGPGAPLRRASGVALADTCDAPLLRDQQLVSGMQGRQLGWLRPLSGLEQQLAPQRAPALLHSSSALSPCAFLHALKDLYWP
jgi:hypothetical protein